MIKAILTILICLTLLAIPNKSISAEPNGVASAIEAIQSFYDETYALIKDLPGKEAEELRKAAVERKALAESELKTMTLTESPSRARFQKAYKIAEDYTGWLTKSLSALKSKAPEMETAYGKTVELRHKKLEELKEAFKYEAAFDRKRPKEVPIIDRSPFETPPEEAPGMWYR